MYEPTMTLAQRLEVEQQRHEASLAATSTPTLPDHDAMRHVKDWPVEARVWFYKAGINNNDIAALGAFWSPSMARVVFPYRTLDGTQGWIARDPWWPNTRGTKYLFPAGTKRDGGAEFLSQNYALSHGTMDDYSKVGVVITEDVLSAFRVAHDTDYDAVAAQGVSLDRDAMVKLANRYYRVLTWLDPDPYGQDGAARIRRDLGSMGASTRNIRSDRDPKFLEPAAIREALEV